MRETDPTPRWAAAIAALIAAAIASWPLVARPLEVSSHPLGESDNHLWMLWRALARLEGRGGPLANLPDGLPLPMMDPINLPLALPGFWIDPALGWNQMLLLNLLLAGAGAGALARELGASRGATAVAAVAAIGAPFLSGVISFGITESWAVGWIGLHAAALLAWGRTGRLRYALAAGACLSAFALSGWYHALFGVVAEIWLAPWAWLRGGRRLGRAVGVLAQGGLALAVTLPRFLAFREVQSFWEWRWRAIPGTPPPKLEMWRETPLWGTDLLNFLLPTLERVPISKSVYLGLAALGVALWAGRRALPLWGLAGSLWVLAMGHWLSIGGQTLFLGRSWSLPSFWLMQVLPDLKGLTHWHRAAGPALIFFAAIVGLGADRLVDPLRGRLGASGARWGFAALAALILCDQSLLSQTPWPRASYRIDPPGAWAALSDGTLPNPGGVVILPFDNGRREFTDDVPRIYNRWQVSLDRPVTENYEGHDVALFNSALIATADRLCGVTPTTPKGWRSPRGLIDRGLVDDPKRLLRELRQLREWEVAYVLLQRDRAPKAAQAERWLTQALGPPALVADETVFFAIASEQAGGGDAER